MRAKIPINVPPGTRVLRIEREPRVNAGLEIWTEGFWIIWLHTNDFINGTFLKLYDDGVIERITVREDQPNEDTTLIKPKDE